ncbi:MAG: substrate-binding domain-containing protein, partial [Ignavibacteria bacterium]|nr:substrate-binding domain-containing protein [Ignavibacteria bacterium]
MVRKPIIGLVMKSLQAEFFQEMKKGALEFAEKQNIFELITVGTSAQTEIDLQIELVDSLMHQKVDAIVLVPIDSKKLVPVVVKAVNAGIKVINIDIKLDEELLKENNVELTYVGPDNETASNIVGNVLAEKLGKDSKVILIEGLQVAENAQQRKNGFLKSIEEHQLNLVASETADWETDKAEQVFTKLFAEHSDIDGVMCCNDAMAIGVIKVLVNKGKSGAIKVVGFDNDA